MLPQIGAAQPAPQNTLMEDKARELPPYSSNSHTQPPDCWGSFGMAVLWVFLIKFASYMWIWWSTKSVFYPGAFCRFLSWLLVCFFLLKSIAEILRATAALLLGQDPAGVCRLELEASPQSRCQKILQAIRKGSWQSRVQSPSIKICLPFLIQNAAGPQQSPPQSLASLGLVQKAAVRVPLCFVPLKAPCRGSAPIPMPIELFVLGPEMEFLCCC